MDNPTPEPTALTPESAADVFASLGQPQDDPEREPDKSPPQDEARDEAEDARPSEADPLVTVKIDGKAVEIPLSELRNGYQRQSDYTRKTQEVSEQRRAAEAEIQRAQQERQTYAMNLQRLQVQDEAALAQQQNIDWAALLRSDPVEYLEQQRIANERQARLTQVYAEQQRIAGQHQAEQAEAHSRHLAQQQDELLAKLPEWRDNAKAAAEKAALRDYLIDSGYDQQAIASLADAKSVVIARKAMLFDQMMSKANHASKRVANLPARVERPGQGESPNLDRRSAAFQKLSKSGSLTDAAALFSSIL
ncbi:hypothetical protein UFOVP73_50 [uncultured Caudovirales phage]|uniref:Scaffolding protein n=1 Tax=uncultured Caudovirales phage TaxID=2100421 RepID=A0A6J7WAL9_9CAUD|nr:hypothetical protein UFOVP73_50 [uncultured Caudovirales phage]CAB5194596.1 hypothetical protein UFOVP170_10 [uncultured Caudovirales phage]